MRCPEREGRGGGGGVFSPQKNKKKKRKVMHCYEETIFIPVLK